MFMLRQAAETTFRSTAVALYGSKRRTHSIRSLKRVNHRLATQLNDIFAGGSPDEERLLQLLEDAYLGARYNPDYQISEQEVRSISSRVLRLLELAEAVFFCRTNDCD
ncbi:HEPN domain-containing protein [Dyadobacter sp. 50-39]|uniref:HEPN domain-containing protein n=1 Tax=Dyadobacter sp. 50-39 TaxID=1895756 RepID=UPI0038D4C852